jgi:hypothetical protein
MTGGNNDITELTIKQAFSQIQISQFWGLLVIIVSLLVGAFTLGYKLSSSVSEAKVGNWESQIDSLRESTKHFRGLEAKERFLALYVRYLLAKEKFANTEEASEEVSSTGEAFEKLIFELWRHYKESGEELEMRGLIIGKGGGPREATVKFIYDGSIWQIPPEFRVAEAAG